MTQLKDIGEYVDCSLESSYVTSHCLAMVSQSGANETFYVTVCFITLNSNCEAQRTSKNLKKIEDRFRSTKLMHEWFDCNFFPF